MRLKLGRPDLDAYADRFDVPVAGPGAKPTVTWLGVATLLLDDGKSALMTDGFFTRPGLLTTGLRKVEPSIERIDASLDKAGVHELEAVIPVHTHYDHALDSAVVAERTGAKLVGGESTANVGRGHQLPEDQLVAAGKNMTFGPYEVTMIESEHCPPDRYPGTITEPVVPPAKASAYRCGEAWSVLINHAPTRKRVLIQGSAGFAPGALDGHSADVVYLGVGQLGVQPEDYLVQYWAETVRAVQARRVVLIHWDDFFRPLTEPLKALPYAGDDLDVSIKVLEQLAAGDGVELSLPRVWEREDPWA